MDGYRTRTLHRDGAELALHVQEGEGPVAFLQHGLCGDATQPAQVFPNGTGWRHAVLDCRGHGQSQPGPPGALSIASFADDLALAVEPLGPSVIGGISMGAAVSLRVAVLRPDLVRALILARPAWVCEAAPANMAPNFEVGERLSRPLQPGEREAFRCSPTGQRLAEEAPDNLASLLGFFDRKPREVTAALLQRISRDGPFVTEWQLRSLRIPVLVIGHDQDLIHPWSHAVDLADLCPEAQLVKLPAKAVDPVGYAQAFRTAVVQFLKDIPHAQA